MSDSFNMDAVTTSMNQSIDQTSQQIDTLATTGDMSDPATLMQMQQEMAEWSAEVQMESNIIKSIGDALKAVAQNTGN